MFSDNATTCGHENMSLNNFIKKYESKLTIETMDLIEKQIKLVEKMNLKLFRNKHIGHYGLNEMLGVINVERETTASNIRELLNNAKLILNKINYGY